MNTASRWTLSLAFAAIWAIIPPAAAADLPVRNSPIPQTTNGVPHVQLGVAVDPDIYEELLLRVSQIPGVDIRETVISLPGAKGFWILDDVSLARPDVIVGGREFAHVHPDGSLHASLPPELARKAVKSGWAAHHPWANERPGWEGFVMIFTPGSRAELNVVVRLVLDSFNFVTGKH